MSFFEKYPEDNKVNFSCLTKRLDGIALELYKYTNDDNFIPTKHELCEIIVLSERCQLSREFVKNFKDSMVKLFADG